MNPTTPPPAAAAPTTTSLGPLWTGAELGWTIAVPLAEIVAVALGCWVAYVVAARLIRLVPRPADTLDHGTPTTLRRGMGVAWAGLTVLTLGYNGWLITQGLPPREHALHLARSMGPGLFWTVSAALAKLAAAAVAVVLLIRVARYLLQLAENAINRWDQVRDNDQSLARFFAGLVGALRATAWLLWLVLGGQLLGVPEPLVQWLWVAVRIQVILAAGLAFVRCTGVIVDTLDGFSQRLASSHDWLRYYDHLRPLVSTFRASLEYIAWIAIAALVLAQIESTRALSSWGPRLIEAIGIFFAGRVVIELGHFEIGHRLLPRAGLTDAERRRRGTMVPLVRSVFTYATYFAVVVLILASIGFNPMPFLAGAGILGLVVGFGAQSLINDVVSGFFILFENVYLVGDTVETGAARGVVEAIEFRTTRIRDDDGRLHIIRNADVGRVINYSSEYALAVVTFEVAYDADISTVFGTMHEAGDKVRVAHPDDTLARLEIGGITRFGEKSLTVRATMRVRPGRHDAVAAALRLAIKEGFDRAAGEAPRRSLLPLPPPAVAPAGFSTTDTTKVP